MKPRSRNRVSTLAEGIVKYTHHMAEREQRAAERHERGLDRPALLLDDRRDREDRAEHDLAEGDDDEQPVALGDVVGMPRRAAHPALDHVGQTSSSAPRHDDDARA